ncbi:MAG: hypothetical protein ABI203_01760 [Mucilaginibacter sp.]
MIELKKSIHQKIDDLNDEKLLELIYRLLNRQNEVFVIPEHMMEGIKQGEQDIRNGDFITMEEFEKRYEKWLK